MEKVCVVFCEGQHDIAFISRVLKVKGFTGYDKKIREFIQPFDTFFMGLLAQKQVSDRKLGYSSDYRVPSVSLCRNQERLVFFHNMGGDGRAPERRELLELYRDLKGEDDFTNDLEFQFRFIFVFDADELGVQHRINEINQELGYDDIVKNGQLVNHDGHEWGAYVFHKENDGLGDLEDIVLEMVSNTENNVITNSEGFLDTNRLPENRTKEFVCTSEATRYKAASKYKHKKSLLNVAGQLQFSGMSNAVFIANSDFLSFEELTNNDHCKRIASLFA